MDKDTVNKQLLKIKSMSKKKFPSTIGRFQCQSGDNKKTSRKGYIISIFGVGKGTVDDKEGWVVTHLPTGYAAGSPYPDKETALTYARFISMLDGWNTTDKEKLGLTFGTITHYIRSFLLGYTMPRAGEEFLQTTIQEILEEPLNGPKKKKVSKKKVSKKNIINRIKRNKTEKENPPDKTHKKKSLRKHGSGSGRTKKKIRKT